MVRRRSPKSLREACLASIPVLVTTHIRRMAMKATALHHWYGALEGRMEIDRDAILRAQVLATAEYIYTQVLWYDEEDVLKAVLKAVEDAVTLTRRGWRMGSNMEQYRQEMDAMSQFADLALLQPRLRRLDFRQVPKSLRSRIVEGLAQLSNLKVLVVGAAPGSSSWLFKSISRKVAEGMLSMANLQHFSCKHDCSAELLAALAETCGASLSVLDVESSKSVNNSCLSSLAQLTNLEELNVFNSGLKDEALARLLLALPKLTRLVKGDFLCDALGWVDYLEEVESPRFLISEFFPSQKYYFHEDWQMEMVARMCPYITKMFFIFNETCANSYMILAPFEYLTEVDLYGGSFYQDQIKDLLQLRGVNLTRLSLIAVNKLDLMSLTVISICCPNLVSLAISNCDVGDFRSGGDPNSDEEYNRRQAFLSMAREACESALVFLHLEEVQVLSACRPFYLSFLLSRCPWVRRISLGHQAEINDQTVLKIYQSHGLRHLEEFHCEKAGPGLTMETILLLLSSCECLKAISDIQSWAGVSPAEVGHFRQMCYEQNLDLDTRSHQKLRRYLEMRDFERRAYVNLMTGPTLERIRMAEQRRRNEEEAAAAQ